MNAVDTLKTLRKQYKTHIEEEAKDIYESLNHLVGCGIPSHIEMRLSALEVYKSVIKDLDKLIKECNKDKQ